MQRVCALFPTTCAEAVQATIQRLRCERAENEPTAHGLLMNATIAGAGLCDGLGHREDPTGSHCRNAAVARCVLDVGESY